MTPVEQEKFLIQNFNITLNEGYTQLKVFFCNTVKRGNNKEIMNKNP